MTLIGIEANDKVRHSKYAKAKDQNVPVFIVAPYPSYIHFLQPDGGSYYKDLFSHHRHVFIFLAAGKNASPFRQQILDRMPTNTTLSVDEYYREMEYSERTELDSMWLRTPYFQPHIEATVQWMRESVFCLQPPGDSPTRKSIYDGILCGCIPVFFEHPLEPIVTLPFQDLVDYSKVSVTIPKEATKRFAEILAAYRKDTKKIRVLQKNLHSIIPYMQYSYPPDNREHTDAMKTILDQLGRTLDLKR
jgi:hypothetical protein